MDLWVIFLTGLTVGGFSCMAVQGGLLASTIAAREEEDAEEGSKKKHNLLPTSAFLVAKLLAYLILGFILGLFGEKLQLSDKTRAIIQIFAGIYMLAIAGDLLNIHPIFRYAIIQPPRFLRKMIKNQSKSKDLFAPASLGFLTIFIPCGTTLAMEALAISSGSPLSGSLIMGAFILGTSPLFFVLGYLTTALGDAFRARFFKIAGILIIYLALTSINTGLILTGSSVNAASLADYIPIQINLGGRSDTEVIDGNVRIVDGIQNVDIQVLPNGYRPTLIRVKAGSPIKLNLTTGSRLSCASAFVIPQLNIGKRLPPNATTSIDIPAQNPGKITFSCAMGMYSGVLEVTE